MKELFLYKVKVEEWGNTEFSAAENQSEAIINIVEGNPDLVPEKCSVTYVGQVKVNIK